MTPSNQERADRCQKAITAYSDDDDLHQPRRFSRRRDALVPTPTAQDFHHRSVPRLAATTSTNSTTNNKTKGE